MLCPLSTGTLNALRDPQCTPIEYGNVDGRRIACARDHRASCFLLLAHRYNLHFRHLCVLPKLPKTYQPAGFLRFMGEHSLQHRDPDVRVTHSRRCRFTSVSIPRLPHSDVKLCPGRRATHQLTYCRFVPADALWNLAMAINVYLTLFKKYNAQQLKALEWKYHLMAYGAPFVIAFIFIFVENEERGKIYGPAVVREPAQDKARLQADSER